MSQEPTKHETVDAEQVRTDALTAERQRAAEIRAAFPADPAFAMAQIEAGVSVTEAKAAYADVLAERLAAREKQSPAQAEPKTGADGRIGAQEAEGNAQAPDRDFMTVARNYAQEHNCTMASAMKAVNRAEPALHEAFLAEAATRAKPVKRTSAERIQE